ncbi:hypothetical protein POM88_029071 [Heracleum sosnowskyi]|uniref:Protein kinase domain-containing protein n=1 Tax=Heracleum sosnowskyi TaxID=360622 RepID=A0AAD8HU14_9APIA|nr:hypothetical protein POM88_029071 [Heracleum sosnowskyi]
MHMRRKKPRRLFLNYVQSMELFNDRTTSRFQFQLCKGVSHCHSHDVLHRDLMPHNLLVDKDKGILKIADLGLGRAFTVPLKCYTHEIDVDICSSTVANGVLGLVIGAMTSLVVDMAFLVQETETFVQLVYADFTQLFKPNWAPDHIVTQGENILLTLDNTTGNIITNVVFYFALGVVLSLLAAPDSQHTVNKFTDSAGIVTAFYMSSEGPNHDELDFEFLGNISGEPYLVQTNVYVNGSGNREQRHTLWFDPTTDFHTYSFFWNHRSIMEHSWQLRFAVFSFLQANTVDELPEKLISAIRVSHVELSSAVVPVLEPGPSAAVVILLCSLHLHHVTIVFLYGSTCNLFLYCPLVLF